MKQLLLVPAILLLSACTSNSEFDQRYDRYFPKYSQNADGIHRRYYDRWLFGPPPPKTYREEARHLYYAFRGDASSAHRFFSEADRNSESDDEMGWITDCAVLLLRLGDDRFSELLAREDPQTRAAVGEALDAQINFQEDPFPKTRALYHSHWRPHGYPSHPMSDQSSPEITLLRAAYAAFNARDIDAALALMTVDVAWPRAFKGGFVRGPQAVRAYWTEQWSEIDPHVEPVAFHPEDGGRILVEVQQTVRDLTGSVLAEVRVGHRFTLERGLIQSMEVCSLPSSGHPV